MEYYIQAASTFAKDVDDLILLVGWLVGFWFFACQGIFFFFIFKYRAKPGVKAAYITGDEPELKRWITIPHMLVLVCDVFILVGAINVWVEIKQTLPPENEATVVRIIGQQWAWSFVHPGPDGKLDTADDIKTVDELHIEVDKPYIYELSARDVVHSFSIPVFRLKQDAVPGRIIKGWFQATKSGVFDLQCAEICGIGHAIMAARAIVETKEQHAAWLAENSPTALAAR